MIPYDVILKKRNGDSLSKEEIEFFINGFVQGSIPDYQMAAMLMAIYFKGMNDEETAHLTMCKVHTGDIVNLSEIPGVKVDKHSTGGVGDTTTLVLAPLVAAAGIPVAKMSGRGLGHTGGTLDKLESIPGVKVDFSREEFINQVKKIGVAVIGQTGNLVPADKKMYALRDVTATVDSIPLIAASIMSKKIAAGTDAILLDVKVGSGAFIPDPVEARKLAKLMVDIGSRVNRKVTAMLTDMDQPLGSHIGNTLEVKEAIEILRGEHAGTPLFEVSLTLGGYLAYMGGASANPTDGRKLMEKLISDGSGLKKFAQLIEAQGGNPKVTEDVKLMPQAKHEVEILSKKSGFVNSFKTASIGMAALILGAGRLTKDDPIDPSVGLIIKKRIGDQVERGEPIATIYGNDEEKMKQATERFLEAIAINGEKPNVPPLILDTITQDKLTMRL
ncbi:MAG: pyrimidine-nucleoside phosphorylase [Firmicutes bacterium]|nr:pyrimidine-nucleoside phosphorylase [Bacillota bacterium]